MYLVQNIYFTVLIGILLFFIVGCPDNDARSDHNQEQIHWPSLANSPWPMYRHNPQGTGRSHLSGLQSGVYSCGLHINSVYSSNAITSLAIGIDSTLYFGSSYNQDSTESQIAYLNAISSNCMLKWRFPLDWVETERTPLITDTGVIIYPSMRSIYAFNHNGTLLWKYSFDGLGVSEMNIGLDGSLYFITSAGLYSLSNDGDLLWLKPNDESFYAGADISFSPDGDVLYATGAIGSSYLYAINPESGTVKWSFNSTDTTLEISSRPIVDNAGNIYFSTHASYLTNQNNQNSKLYSVRPDGSIRWMYDTSPFGSFNDRYTLDSEGNIIISLSEKIVQLDYYGQERWIKILTDSENISPLIADCNGNIYYTGSHFNVLSSDNGITEWTIELNGTGFQCPIISYNNTSWVGVIQSDNNQIISIE